MSTQSQSQSVPQQLDALWSRIDELEDELSRKDDRIAELEQAVEEKDDRIDELEESLSETRAIAKASMNKASANKDRVNELQAREIEKGAHLLESNVDELEIDVAEGRLERIKKEDGNSYFRLPESEDPLNRGGSTTLAHGDLLPIQQLAQMDDDMLHSTTNDLPSRLAAKLWKARSDPTVGDNPWKKGSKGVREYVKASDMKHWIRRQESGVSENYAKKLVSRTIDRLKEFSNNRLAIRKKSERKNGLAYQERRVLLMEDAEIPGETTSEEDSPATDGVLG